VLCFQEQKDRRKLEKPQRPQKPQKPAGALQAEARFLNKKRRKPNPHLRMQLFI